jgi:ATP-binding cassette, subfamily A (ABC1), member 3
MTMFLNFGTILFATTLVFYMRWMNSWEVLADDLSFWLRILPPYMLGETVNFDSNFKALAEYRANTPGTAKNLNVDPWVMENTLGSVVWVVVHFVFWFALLIAIENGCAKGCSRCCLKCKTNRENFPKAKQMEELDLNEDVKLEEERIA